MTVQVGALPWVPPFAQGNVRDLRVRWALEEAGIQYVERLVSAQDQKSAAYRALQPFGQVPTYEQGEMQLFSRAPSFCILRNNRRRCFQQTRSHGNAPRPGCLLR